MLAVPFLTSAQTADRNYVLTRTYLSSGNSNNVTSIQYFDGLGRPTLSVSDGIGGEGKGVYSLVEYDNMGRESVKWLPGYSLNCTTNYIKDIATALTFECGKNTKDETPFSVTSYDALNRPLFVTTPGDDWGGKGKSVEYITNGKDDVRYLYTVDVISGNFMDGGYYAPCTLTGETTTDEDGHSVTVFKNKQGNVVLERKHSDNEYFETYYVYSYSGLLRFVLTPEYFTCDSSEKEKFMYSYKYNDMNLCIEKKLPGCGPTTFVYDDKDRVVITQDMLLNEKGLYRFTLYDNYGRLAIQGTTSSYKSTMVNNSMATKANLETDHDSTGYYFCDQLFSEGLNIEMINYYDDYYFFDHSLFSNFEGKDKLDNSNKNAQYSKGSLTGQIVATTDGKMLYNTFYYDQKGSIIDERHSTLDGDVYKITTEYSFTDKPTQTTKVLRYGQPDSYAIETSYQYNQHNDQLAKVTVSHGGKSEDVSEIIYNDLGQIQKESRANNADDVEYSYELHGWTKTIKKSSFFEEELYYADAIYGADSRYNGDISAQSWKVGNKKHAYAFTYDDRDMLTNATYSLVGSTTLKTKNRFSESATYNANGGITSLTRRGKNNNNLYSDIDKLTYEYDGNQLKNITDAVGTKLSYRDAFEYVDGHKGTEALPDFEYNGAGMLVKDLDKGISKIIYNNIGLVDSICFSNGSRVKYVYAMTGEKLRVTHYTSNQLLSTGRLELGTNSVSGVSTTASTQTMATVGLSSTSSTSTTPTTRPVTPTTRVPLLSKSSETLYIGGDIQVDMNGTYTHIFGGGYSEFKPEVNNPDSIKYYYYTKDHLGNIRNVLLNDNGTMTELQHTSYYPFGGIIADLSTGRDVQNRTYNGKEQDFSNNLFWLDYGARQYDPTRGQFTTPDPLAEKYYGWNYYTYCVNNPMKYVDPDGRDVHITGKNTSSAIKSLSKAVGKGLKLEYNAQTESLCYTIVNKEKLGENAKIVINAIDNCDIDVELRTINTNKYNNKFAVIGGAYMGVRYEDGTAKSVNVVNPKVLSKMDKFSPKGTSIMHELSESYNGAMDALKNKQSYPASYMPGTNYIPMHNSATPQAQVEYYEIDKDGLPTSHENAVGQRIYVTNGEETSTVLIWNYEKDGIID